MSFRKNLAATGDYVRTSLKTMGTKRKIKQRKGQVAKIQASKQNLASAMRGGAKGGTSMSAASRLAETGSFDGGATPRKKGGGGYR